MDHANAINELHDEAHELGERFGNNPEQLEAKLVPIKDMIDYHKVRLLLLLQVESRQP